MPLVLSVSNVSQFQLPDAAGRAGGACTSTLLQVLYKDHHDVSKSLSYSQALNQMREILAKKGFSQIPQASFQAMFCRRHPWVWCFASSLSGTSLSKGIGAIYTLIRLIATIGLESEFGLDSFSLSASDEFWFLAFTSRATFATIRQTLSQL
jgi:hypothetical protein